MELSKLFIFVKSYRLYHPKSKGYHLFIFIPELDERLDEYQKLGHKLNFEIVEFDERKYTAKRYHLNTYRFFLYRHWLKENSEHYRGIFLSDSSDVVFNDNVFDNIPKDSEEYQYFFWNMNQ
eukprot:UN04664